MRRVWLMAILAVSGCATATRTPIPEPTPIVIEAVPLPVPVPMPMPTPTVTVTRYPTLEAPDEVRPGDAFAVQVSLTELQLSPDVKVRSGKVTAEGKLELQLSDKAKGEAWKLDVALSAPGFEIVSGQNFVSITLPDNGDSDPALFQLRAKALAVPKLNTELYATFWEKGRFLAKVSKSIAVVSAAGAAAAPSSPVTSNAPPPTARRSAQDVGATIGDGQGETPDLTLWVLEGLDPSRPNEMNVLVQSPFLQPVSATQAMPPDLDAWLLANYRTFAGRSARGAKSDVDTIAAAARGKDETIAMMRGFGRELFTKFAPPVFKTALGQLQATLGTRFQSVQIFTNSPRLPWELMVATAPGANGETDFLGIEYRVARWHISNDSRVLGRPATRLNFDRLNVLAPKYATQEALPSQAIEVASLRRLASDRFRLVDATLGGIGALLAGIGEPTSGIIHFAGHGTVMRSQERTPSFAIKLASGELNLLMWKGLSGSWGGGHPLIFLNACDVGLAERTAGFVDGWGPAVLEKGASGYIGGLWPLGDKAAADFAARFYEAGIPSTSAVAVADALRTVRRRFYETGDPTYLAYVFYGDAALTFVRPP